MRALPRRYIPLILCAALGAASAYAQSTTVLGYWREPAGSVFLISPCEHALCVRIAMLSSRSPAATDRHNPDPKLRNRLLCGLRIGEGFVQIDPQHARGGHLYDPRSGRTYSGQMTAEGNLLHLRGYVGLPIFGRTATWSRASQPPPCSASP
jgi:uncharacterized protein (DUF2147 family)